MSGTVSAPEGITNPPIDDLLEATDSKYSLVISLGLDGQYAQATLLRGIPRQDRTE